METLELDAFSLGYALGIITGEGSFTGDKKQACLSVRLHANDKVTIDCLHAYFGGRVFGPYLHNGRNYCAWMLRGPDLIAALPTFYESLPPSNKRLQFIAWAERYGLSLT